LKSGALPWFAPSCAQRLRARIAWGVHREERDFHAEAELARLGARLRPRWEAVWVGHDDLKGLFQPK